MEQLIKEIEDIFSCQVNEYIDSYDYYSSDREEVLDLIDKYVRLKCKELEKIKRIAYLQGVTKYTIWADCVPNGNEICDKYQKELKRLLSNEA